MDLLLIFTSVFFIVDPIAAVPSFIPASERG